MNMIFRFCILSFKDLMVLFSLGPQPSNVTTYPLQEYAMTVPLNQVVVDLILSSKNSILILKPIASFPTGMYLKDSQ